MSSPICAKLSDKVAIVDKIRSLTHFQSKQPTGQRKQHMRIPFIPVSEVKALLTVFFHTPFNTLMAQDNDDSLQPDRAITYDGDGGGPTTGRNAFDILTWSEVNEIIERLDERKVFVSGVQQTGWYAYVLRCWTSAADPHSEKNEHLPVPTDKHRESALKQFLREVERYL